MCQDCAISDSERSRGDGLLLEATKARVSAEIDEAIERIFLGEYELHALLQGALDAERLTRRQVMAMMLENAGFHVLTLAGDAVLYVTE